MEVELHGETGANAVFFAEGGGGGGGIKGVVGR